MGRHVMDELFYVLSSACCQGLEAGKHLARSDFRPEYPKIRTNEAPTRNHSNSTRTVPASTVAPGSTRTRATVPADSATSSFSIFIASRTTRA